MAVCEHLCVDMETSTKNEPGEVMQQSYILQLDTGYEHLSSVFKIVCSGPWVHSGACAVDCVSEQLWTAIEISVRMNQGNSHNN